MSAVAFLTELSRQGVKVWADDGQLRCRAPKGVITPVVRSKLAEYKAELLTLLSRPQEHDPIMPLPRAVPAPAQLYLPFPTTDVQQAYWIGRGAAFELGNVGNHGYIEVEAIDLDMARSLLILRQLIERHPMLRAVMLPDGQQRILEHVPPFQVECIDLEGLTQQEVAEQLEHIRYKMDHQIFEVEQWPTLEIRVSRLPGQRVRVHLSMESLFADSWSIRILLQEILHLYHEPEASLPPLELSFRDYILAETQLQTSELYRRSQDYWTQRLQDLPPAPNLPLASDPASLQQPRFVPRKARLDAGQWQQLKARGAQAGLTPSGVLLAAFAEVLTTWSKNPCFCINLTVFHRLPVHKQVNDIVGDFSSLLLLAVDNSYPDTFEQRAKRLQEQLWRDFDHHYYSGVRVLRDLAQMQGSTAQAMMPVVFTSLLGQETTTIYPAPWQEAIYWVTQTPQVWLDHQVLEEAGNLVLYWQAVEALFPPGLLDAMFESYTRFLHRLATDDALWQASSCELVPSSQLAQRARINATQAPISDQLLHSGFLEQVSQRPDHLAVISLRRNLTYQEVLREATLLGHQLRQEGARPNHLVAVVMEKGWEQVVGVLGVLLSGAAYLPIDPKLPQERLTFLLKHGEVEMVMTQSWIEKTVQWPERLTRLCVDELDLTMADMEPLDSRQGPEDLAYVIYTSGSTGLPKGVMIDHRGAVNTILDINERFGVSSTDRVLALSALNFDLSVYDIFGVLAAGGTIVMPAEDAWRNPAVWVDLLVQERVTLWNTVPALLEMLIEYTEAHAEALRGFCLRLALLSGDWIPVSLPDRLRRLIPEVEMVSLGGATEVSIWSILYPITVVDPSWKSIPYGRPLRNQRFFVLNERLDSCPVWVPGQLYIGGIGLAKGYWHDEEKTQASFFSHPQTGERFYRTGDLGRYLPDGTIEFLGREDFQVKILGHRIELGEIEVVLGQHPQVGTAVVVVQKGESGEQQLVAYVVRKESGSELSSQTLRIYLQGKLPEYMVPSQVVFLENLPLTLNGKVDRRALPIPEEHKTEGSSVAAVAARTPIEEILGAIWCEVLGRSHVGIHDNFFALGGQSLLAMRLIARVKEMFGVELPLFDLFGALTVAEMARCVEDALRGQGQKGDLILSLPQIMPAPAQLHLPFPTTDVQQAYWIGRGSTFELGNVGNHGYGEVEATNLDLARSLRILRQLIKRHPMLRAVMLPDGQQQVLEHVPPFYVECIDLEGLGQQEIHEHLEYIRYKMDHHVFQVEQWPTLEIRVSRLPERRVRIHISMESLFVDAWSLRILLQEFLHLYYEPEASLPPLELSFRDYVLAEAQLQASQLYQRSQDYWAQRLRDLPPAPDLPLAIDPASLEQPRFMLREARLEALEWQRLKARGARAGLTPSGILLAAFAEVLTTWSKSPCFCINLTVFHRLPLHEQVNDIVGDFTSLLLLAVDNSHPDTFEQRAKRLQEQLWRDFGHRYYSGVRVLRDLAQMQGSTAQAMMPVVFTSLLGQETAPAYVALWQETIYWVTQTPQVWLDHQVLEEAGNLMLYWQAVEALFPAGLLEDMFEAYVHLLHRLATDEEVWQASSCELVPPSQLESRALINATEAPVSNRLLQSFFVEQAIKQPDHLAVISARRSLTYEELLRESTLLGHQLRQLGARPNHLVAVVMEKGWEQVVGVLGVLLSGAAYVPIDPTLPQERLTFLLNHGEVEIVVTQTWIDKRLQWPEQLTRLCVDEQERTRTDVEPLDIKQGPQDLAYVIYTSGSTGLPKGVMIDHRGAVNTILDMNGRFGVGNQDRVLALSALNFDLSVYDLFGVLAAGGTIVMPAQEAWRNPAVWVDLLVQEQVTLWNTVPALLEMLVEYTQAHAEALSGSCLRLALLSGDWIPVWLPDRLRRVIPEIEMVSLGGATEASIWSILYPMRGVEPSWKSIPYGKPLRNQRFSVLNEVLQPCPVWVPGQLYIGGIGLAKGYWRDEEKTQASFFAHPRTGERLYRTGDLGRYLPDGNIEFLGREDFQVKILGHRIELGEIEVVLGQHPQVRTAVVVVRQGGSGEQQLVAYVVRKESGTELSSQTLRIYLQGKLPEYMVPSRVMLVESLPLTPNGKVDRRALPIPQEHKTEGSSVAAVAARTPIEEILGAIWCEVLGCSHVGIHDNFFALGGQSLLAMRLIARVKEMFRVEFPLFDLFGALTVAEMARCVEDGFHRSQAIEIPPLVRIGRTRELPLSFAQQRLWFLDQFEPEGRAYIVLNALRLCGFLNTQALEQSLVELIRRHEVLRTTFVEQAGEPQQVIGLPCILSLPLVDMCGLRPEEGINEVRRLSQQEAEKSFDLAQGPLLRTLLLRLDVQEYVLLLTLHHIIGDSWSIGVFIDELAKLYEAFSAGVSSPLPDLPIQYVDFAVWQREWLQKGGLERQLAYWVNQLDGIVPLEFPTDHPRPPIQTFCGAHQSYTLSPALVDKLKELSRQENATLFMTVLAAFQTLLLRYTGQTDVAVGMTVANRPKPEVEGLIGLFVNTLVIRTNLSHNPPFRTLLGKVRERVIEAIANQDIPFEELVAKLQPERQLSRSPFFQIEFTFHNSFPIDISLGDILVTPLPVESGTAKFDLTVEMMDTSQGLNILLEYNTDLFEASTIQRIIGAYRILLEGIVANPDQCLSDLPLLTEAERRQILVEWNTSPRRGGIQATPLHQAFEAQVRQTPDAVALVFENEFLTYDQLNARANQLAHYLCQLGVGPEMMVGTCLDSSPDLLIGVLGILKAGGAYVPLDPSSPAERLKFIMADAHLTVVVTSLARRSTVRQLKEDITLLCLDQDASLLAEQNIEDVQVSVFTEHLAYVIYTSGSTGEPKGILVTHANVHRLFAMTQAWYRFQAEDVWTLFHSSAFDFSVWEIWGAFLHGGRLVVVPYWVSRSPDMFYRLLINQQVTVLNQTPSAFRLLVLQEETNQAMEALTLRLVIFGGEALDLGSLQPWVTRHGDRLPQLINMYGITETTVHVTYRPLSQRDLAAGIGSVIGRAIPDLQLYILDNRQQLVPIGVPGELYVGGMGLARGYLHRPELTAERFIPHPWSEQPGMRLYRTGDLVRYCSDGDIEYLGRVDQQVKIRGFRIELGEIEATLMGHPAIQEAVVLAREDILEDKCLVVYVVGEESKRLAADELRRYLQEKLPDYMIPAFFVLLDALPLTPNGKVDRRALPAPEESELTTADWIAARTPVEEVVLAIYCEILGIGQISIHDSFFEWGGHSLLAIQVISRIRSVMGVELSVRSLFETPSVAGLAKQIEQKLRSGQERAMPLLVPVAREQDFPLSFAQQRLWFQEQLVSGHSAYVLPLTVRLHGPLHVAILEKSLQEMLHRHESLRTTFVTRSGQPAQIIHSHLHVELAVIDLQAVEEDKQFPEVLQFLNRELLHPFDLNNGPLLRMGLFHLQDQDHILYFVIHHIIFDGWSTGIFFHELSILYEAFLQGKPSPLPPLALQYADFARWQRQWLQGEVLDALITYWTKQLRGAVPLEMPTDRPRAASMSNRGAIHPFTLSSHLWQKLITLSRQEGVTLFMTLLTAFQILLYRSTGVLDIVVGTDSADRTATETEQMIGFFVNLLALRVRLSPQANFRETVRSVCATVLGAYTHQNLPFEKLVDALQLERNPYQIPLVNVLFVLQNMPQQLPELSELTASPVDVEIHTAKFDLALFLMERAQEIIGYVNYRADLFDPGSIARLCLHFETLLESIVASPDFPIERLEIFTEDEKKQKLSKEAMQQETLRRELKVTKRHMITLPNKVF
jgi:amino acid adenylation domain-containing protein